MKIAIVYGYGVVHHSNEKAIQFYQTYFDGIVQIINDFHIDHVIFCGGYTSAAQPHLSEAQSMVNEIIKTLPNLSYTLDEESMTTVANIQNVVQIIDKLKHDSKIEEIHSIGSNIHIPKIMSMSLLRYAALVGNTLSEHDLYQGLYDFSVEVKHILQTYHFNHKQVRYHGVDLNRSIEGLANQILYSIVDQGFDKFEDIHQQFITQRKKIWGIS